MAVPGSQHEIQLGSLIDLVILGIVVSSEEDLRLINLGLPIRLNLIWYYCLADLREERQSSLLCLTAFAIDTAGYQIS